MRLMSLLAIVASARGLDIPLTHDDGFGTASIRELYREMTALGHNCYIAASSSDQSGQAAHLILADSATLDADSTPDLVMTRPNDGLNAGPLLYSTSRTLGATMTAVERGISVRVLPLGYGTSVDIPLNTSLESSNCLSPPVVLSKAVYDNATGLFGSANFADAGTSVSTTDYDAPHSSLGATASVEGTASTTSRVATAAATSLPRSEGERQKQVDAMSSLALVIGVAAVLTLL